MAARNRARIQRFWRTAMCISSAVLLSTLITACKRADADVQTELQRQLDADAITGPAHLTVTVKEGVAQIRGITDTQAQQTRAVDIARAVKGVTLAEPAMRLNDGALKRALLAAIAADPSVSSVPLNIEVVDGGVRLFSDQTNADQRTRLVQIARGFEGVTGVQDLMK